MLASDNVIPQLEIEEIEYNYAGRFAGEAIVIYVKHCRVVTLQQLIEKNQVFAGKKLKDYGAEFSTIFGFFTYQQDSVVPLPYQCMGQPTTPLLLEDLPEHIQNAVSWNWFDNLHFGERQAIQPIEHMRCATWHYRKWWVDIQGQEHEGHPHDPL